MSVVDELFSILVPCVLHFPMDTYTQLQDYPFLFLTKAGAVAYSAHTAADSLW